MGKVSGPLHPYSSLVIASPIALYCCALAPFPSLLRNGSPSLVIDARRLPFPYECVQAHPPSLLAHNLPYCCALYTLLVFSLVLSPALFSRFK
jgi:hypothetical protein